MVLNVNIDENLKCKQCGNFEQHKHYGRCLIPRKIEKNEIDKYILRQPSAKACYEYVTIADRYTIKQLVVKKFLDKVLEQIEKDAEDDYIDIYTLKDIINKELKQY